MPRLNKTVYTKRQTNLSWAICSTLMCICFPIGLGAVLVALKSKKAWKDDRPESAGDLADMAKTISLVAVLLSIVVICIFTALLASGYFYKFLYSWNLISKSKLDDLVNSQGEGPAEVFIDADRDDANPTTTESEYYYYYENEPVEDTTTKKPPVKRNNTVQVGNQ